ncbi:MAG: tail fiber domain-containing protein, partial [Saprospiraceae bacterium]
ELANVKFIKNRKQKIMLRIALLISCTLMLFSWNINAQGLTIDYNSSSSQDRPQINLIEDQVGDFARIRMQTTGNSNFWEIAGRTGDKNDHLNFFFLNDDENESYNMLSLRAIDRIMRVGSSSTNINLELLGDADMTGNVDVGGTLDVTGLVDLNGAVDINGKLNVTDDIELTGGLILDPSGFNDAKITLEAPDNNNEATIEFKEQTLNNIDLQIKNGSAAGSIEFFTSSNTSPSIAISSAGNVQAVTTSGDNFRVGIISTSKKLGVGGEAAKTGGGNTWDAVSDKRLKKEIRDFEEGLDILQKIRPVWFKYNGKVGTNPDKQEVGILAQDIQKIAPYMISEFVHKEESNGKEERYLSYNSNALQYIVVNSIQEQQQQIEEQAAIIEQQSDEIADLKNSLARIESMLAQNTLPTAPQSGTLVIDGANQPRLEQNFPNPFNELTVIKYFLPEVNESAQIHINDQSGKVLKSYSITEQGEGQLELHLKDFPAGTYSYSLQVGERVIATKQMIQTK